MSVLNCAGSCFQLTKSMQTTSDSITDEICVPVNFSTGGSSNSERVGDVAIMPADVTSSVETSDPYSYLNRGELYIGGIQTGADESA